MSGEWLEPALVYRRTGVGTGRDEQFYRNLFDAAPCALLSIGTDGRILAVNQRALHLLGYQLSEMVGHSVLDLYSPGPAGKVLAGEVFRRLRIGLEIPAPELEMQRADGTQVRVRLFVQPIRDMEGHFLASCSMIEDISATQLVDHGLTRHEEEPTSKSIDSSDGSTTAKERLERVVVKSAGSAYLLNVNEIDWFGAAGNYIELNVGSRTYLLRRTMKDVEGLLDPSQFLRIHRATIVNTERITEFRARAWGDYDVILRDGVRLILSRAYRKKLQGFLRNDLKLRQLATSSSRASSRSGL
jgi:PAS domain S-box-containing protein